MTQKKKQQNKTPDTKDYTLDSSIHIKLESANLCVLTDQWLPGAGGRGQGSSGVIEMFYILIGVVV